jgi:hypothetical protein
MQTEFPEQEGYSGLFALGFYKNGGGTRRAGVVIVKRTYAIAGGTLMPAAENSLPVFLSDMPDNKVINSDFTGNVDDWTADDLVWVPDGSITPSIQEPESANGRLRIVQNTGSSGRIVQTFEFEDPLGGRRFQLSFNARGLVGGESISNVRLEAEADDGSVATICSLTRNNLPTTWTRVTSDGLTANQTTFPADLTATKMRLVLRGANTTGQTVEYDRVQVEERDQVTVWNSMTMLRYENDIAPVKPFVDIIVPGNATTTGLGVIWRVRVKPYWGDGNPEPAWDNGMIWLARSSLPAGQKAMFGWQPKDDGDSANHRQRDAGTFTDEAADLPPEWPDPAPNRDPLPNNFSNNFYAGQMRLIPTSRQQAPPLDPRARIRVETSDGVSTDTYDFQLIGDTLTASLATYSGSGADDETAWQNTPVTMQLDTLVIEPDLDQCYLIWRGAWDFDSINEEDYRRLTVSAN